MVAGHNDVIRAQIAHRKASDAPTSHIRRTFHRSLRERRRDASDVRRMDADIATLKTDVTNLKSDVSDLRRLRIEVDVWDPEIRRLRTQVRRLRPQDRHVRAQGRHVRLQGPAEPTCPTSRANFMREQAGLDDDQCPRDPHGRFGRLDQATSSRSWRNLANAGWSASCHSTPSPQASSFANRRVASPILGTPIRIGALRSAFRELAGLNWQTVRGCASRSHPGRSRPRGDGDRHPDIAAAGILRHRRRDAGGFDNGRNRTRIAEKTAVDGQWSQGIMTR